MFRESIMIVEIIDSLSKTTIHNLSKMYLQHIEIKVFSSRYFKDFAMEKLRIIYDSFQYFKNGLI